jgi:hypothetical protein
MTFAVAVCNPVLDEHANAIRALRSRIVKDVAEIGRILAEVKEMVGHGNWLPWLDREFGWEETTALNFMRVHKFVQELPSESANVCVFHMPVSSVYLLAAPNTPVEAREEIIERVRAGEMVPVAEVKRTVEKARKQPTPEQIAKREAKKQAKLEADRAELQRLNAECEAQGQRLESSAQAVAATLISAGLGQQVYTQLVADREFGGTYLEDQLAKQLGIRRWFDDPAETAAVLNTVKEAIDNATGNDVDPAESAKARKAEFARAEDEPAPAAKKKRGRPPGSKNKKKKAA